ncbi:hypothetical protein OKA05_04220 [Luteolibacter arcticus]|uniref:DUF4412 domain-containing protein n=1 Tax=Luteolibacter arcticus TaxID=1581411 RepID=A0ABT3GDP3_9BACT|nr:hypothetical protein [Luteolibacter arcticus]MCW1921745.1 hypothetical protein [Luteolibacter arcticus]
MSLIIMGGLAHGQLPAEPLKLETLTTSKGKTYKNLTVREVTPSSIKIIHEGGTATLPYEELPVDLRKMVGGFDPEKAKKHRAEEDNKLTAQENQLERELSKIKKEEKATPSTTPSPSKDAPASPEAPGKAPADKGELTARIVGYKTGIKRVEFKALTNCAAQLRVNNVVPDGHTETFDVTAKVPFTREVWVYNDYTSELHTPQGKQLDSEDSRQKTDTGRFTPTKLK